MKGALLTAALLLGLAACVAPQGGSVAGPALVAALDSQPDGFTGATATGARFRIVSTSASSSRLCRVVSIDTATAFEVESFCKAPGGQWR